MLFRSGEPVNGLDAAELDLTFASIFITLSTDALVQTYNDKKFCGGGWEKGKQRQITRATCGAELTDEPDMFYEIFALKGGALYFGKKDVSHGGRIESQRPVAIDESRPFAKS